MQIFKQIYAIKSASIFTGNSKLAVLVFLSLFTETFTVDDALEAIGYGKFQWKLSLLTGLSWVRIQKKHTGGSSLWQSDTLHLSCIALPMWEQIGDAMEMMILSILSPQLHCEWRLPSYQVAMITAVRSPQKGFILQLVHFEMRESVSLPQVVFVGMCFGSPSWGNMADNYGRKVVSIIWGSKYKFYLILVLQFIHQDFLVWVVLVLSFWDIICRDVCLLCCIITIKQSKWINSTTWKKGKYVFLILGWTVPFCVW